MSTATSPPVSGNTTDAHCVGMIPAKADCSLCRYGILHGLYSAFPALDQKDLLDFGLPQQPERGIPVMCTAQITDAAADLMFQWVRGFCCGFLQRST